MANNAYSIRYTPPNIGDMFLEAKKNKDNQTIETLKTAVQFEMQKREKERQRQLAKALATQMKQEYGIELPAEFTPQTLEEVKAIAEIPLGKISAQQQIEGLINTGESLNIITPEQAKKMREGMASGKVPPQILGDILTRMLSTKGALEEARLRLRATIGRAGTARQLPIGLMNWGYGVPTQYGLESLEAKFPMWVWIYGDTQQIFDNLKTRSGYAHMKDTELRDLIEKTRKDALTNFYQMLINYNYEIPPQLLMKMNEVLGKNMATATEQQSVPLTTQTPTETTAQPQTGGNTIDEQIELLIRNYMRK